MNNLKLQLQQRLIANVIIDKCATNNKTIFRDSWCSQDRIIRFTTPVLRVLFQTVESTKGYWKTGDMAIYEVHLLPDSFSISCLVSKISCTVGGKEIIDVLTRFPTFSGIDSNIFLLRKWEYNPEDSIDKVFFNFDLFIEEELNNFEENLSVFIEEQKQVQYLEGAKETYYGSKYERNTKAREACLAHYGTACIICGIDFGKTYGPEFAGKIEVYHIVPISQIGEEYVVDPIKDLVPLCPNCHTAIHSKKEGVYTIEEMRKLCNM